VVRQHRAPLLCPILLLIEVVAAVARALDDADRAMALAAALHGLPNQTLVLLDEALADRAIALAALARPHRHHADHPRSPAIGSAPAPREHRATC